MSLAYEHEKCLLCEKRECCDHRLRAGVKGYIQMLNNHVNESKQIEGSIGNEKKSEE